MHGTRAIHLTMLAPSPLPHYNSTMYHEFFDQFNFLLTHDIFDSTIIYTNIKTRNTKSMFLT